MIRCLSCDAAYTVEFTEEEFEPAFCPSCGDEVEQIVGEDYDQFYEEYEE